MAEQAWKLTPTERHLRVEFNGETIADTTKALLMIEHPGELHYYFPESDVKQDALQKSDEAKKSGYRGDATQYHVTVGDKTAENAAWSYPKFKERRPDLRGYIAFDWPRMDAWYEEDEQVYLHPRNPYHRVDGIRSSRHVEVVVNGETIAESDSPMLVFETGLPVRFYLPPEDVKQEVLTHTDEESICPYKGFAEYWSVTVGDNTYENIVWAYPEPFEGNRKLAGLMAFWPEKSDDIQVIVDGEPYTHKDE